MTTQQELNNLEELLKLIPYTVLQGNDDVLQNLKTDSVAYRIKKGKHGCNITKISLNEPETSFYHMLADGNNPPEIDKLLTDDFYIDQPTTILFEDIPDVVQIPQQELNNLQTFLGNEPYVLQKDANDVFITNFKAGLGSITYRIRMGKHGYTITKIKDKEPEISFYHMMPDDKNNLTGINKLLIDIFDNCKPTIFLFEGRPGAGKTTHSEKFAQKYGIPVVHTGREVDKFIEEQKQLSQTVTREEKSNKSKEIFEKAIAENPNKSICIDGFPRTEDQLKWLLKIYSQNYNIFTIHLSANKENALELISKRDEGRPKDQDSEFNEVRMRFYGRETHNTIMALKELARESDTIYYVCVNILSGAEKEDNFKLILGALYIAIRDRHSKNVWEQMTAQNHAFNNRQLPCKPYNS